MNMYPYPHGGFDDPVFFYLWPSRTRIRVYYIYPIASGNFNPEILAQSLQLYHPLPYPYTWYVSGEDAAVVNIIDLQQSPCYSNPTFRFYQQFQSPIHHDDDDAYMIDQTHPYHYSSEPIDETAIPNYHYSSESIDETVILQDLNMNQINESFEQASEFVACSGLSNKLISKNMKVTEYHHEEEEEESEVCVVCQVEFQDNEGVGVLQCRHRFHPQCIKEWLLRKNLCPLCKVQAFKIS